MEEEHFENGAFRKQSHHDKQNDRCLLRYVFRFFRRVEKHLMRRCSVNGVDKFNDYLKALVISASVSASLSLILFKFSPKWKTILACLTGKRQSLPCLV